MIVARVRRVGAPAALALALVAAACRPAPPRREVVVFGASSLATAFRELEPRFEAEHPGLELRFEPSGSQVAVRKLTELGRRADAVASADWRLLEGAIVPGRADWMVVFARDELVLAFAEHSPRADEITAETWSRVLLDPQVRLGRASERTAPLGQETLAAWRRAGTGPGGVELARALEARCRPEDVAADAEELVALLASRSIDYAFVYRSLAESHRLRALELPPALNLGSTIRFAVSVPRDAPNRRGGEALAAFLLGPQGQDVLERAGLVALRPARVRGPGPVPVAVLRRATEDGR